MSNFLLIIAGDEIWARKNFKEVHFSKYRIKWQALQSQLLADQTLEKVPFSTG
jgi:hypothetical protein